MSDSLSLSKKQILKQILMKEDIEKSINDNLDIILNIIPEVEDMIDFPHNHPHHHLDVWNHTLYAMTLSKEDFDLRLSLLLHDIGKPHSYQDKEVRIFKGHPHASSIITNDVLTRLNYDPSYVREITYLVENHDNPINQKQVINYSDLCFKRFLIQYCDAMAHHPDKLERRIQYLKRTYDLLSDYTKDMEEKVKTKVKYKL